MSSRSGPITAALFADAIKDIPLSLVYSKAAELQNSISHLQRSNNELRNFIADAEEPEEDKRKIQQYIVENEGVIDSMTERIRLLRAEVEARGQPWVGKEDDAAQEVYREGQNGTSDESSRQPDGEHADGGVYL